MKSIAFKLWVGMMALVSVVLILLWLFQIVFLEKFYTDIRISNIKKEGFSIIKELEEENKLGFEQKVDEFAYNNNASIELLDLNNHSLYAIGTMGMHGQMPMMKNNFRIEAYKKVLEGKTVLVPMTHPRFGSQFMLIGLPVNLSGELEGVLFISFPMAPVQETVQILKKQLFYITIILLISALLFSFLLSKTFTKPILDIIKVSEEMAEGRFSARVFIERKDEIGRLGETINYMGQELTKIDQLRKDLIANVSHELRTPLSLIKGYAETIRDISGDLPEKRDKHVGIIIEESNRLSRMVDDILNLSQMQAGYIKLNRELFIINHLIEQVVKRYEWLCSTAGIKINLEGAIHEVVVEADENKIEQVLYNLINNAFYYSKQGDIVTVAVSEGNDVVKIEVSDTGRGIPKDEIPYIWDRFYKIDGSSKNKTEGTGLGLAIVKNILEAHQANYGVESQLDRGTTFWFEIKKWKQ